MDKIDRVQKLHQILLHRHTPISLRELAEKLDCSEKTARRLIDTLQDLTFASIDYDEERKGWAYTCQPEEKNQLPGLWLTAQELQSMALLLHMLQNFGNGLLADELRVVERGVHKLLKARNISPAAVMNHIKVLPMAHRPVPNDTFVRVSDALLRRRRILLRYTRYDGSTTRRLVSPLDLVYYRDNWYLDAWCHEKNAFRQFVLARMEKVTLTDDPIIDIDPQEQEEHFAGSYGIFAGAPRHVAVLRFRSPVAREVASQSWHPQQEGRWDGDEYVLQFPYGDDRELVRDVMRFVPDVVVEGPVGLREGVIEKLREGLAIF